jgi:hypothetical protein
MASVVATLFVIGGTNQLTKVQLGQICDLMGIDPARKALLPVGHGCTYFLQLRGTAELPKTCPDPNHPSMQLMF